MIAAVSLRSLYVRLFLACMLICFIMSVCADDDVDSYERPARAPKAKFIRFGKRSGQKFIRFGRSSSGPAALNDDQMAYWLSMQERY